MDKYWRNSMFILGLTVLALSLCGACYGESQKLPIQDRREAIAIANQVTGFDKLANFSDVIITARQVVIEEDDTVLSEWIQGRSLWKVSYVNVILPRTEIAEPLEKIDAFDVFVDTETGIVPKLVSQRIPDLKYRKWIHKFQEEMKQRLLSKKKARSNLQCLKFLLKSVSWCSIKTL